METLTHQRKCEQDFILFSFFIQRNSQKNTYKLLRTTEAEHDLFETEQSDTEEKRKMLERESLSDPKQSP